MDYLIALAVAAFVLFQITKKINSGIYEKGRHYVASIDILTFMQVPYSSLTTPGEKAGFHFLVQRPWKESAVWFGPLLDLKDDLDEGRITDSGQLEFAPGMYADMVANPLLPLIRKLIGIPAEIRSQDNIAYRAWSSQHSDALKTSPSSSIGEFVSVSSRAASVACKPIRA